MKSKEQSSKIYNEKGNNYKYYYKIMNVMSQMSLRELDFEELVIISFMKARLILEKKKLSYVEVGKQLEEILNFFRIPNIEINSPKYNYKSRSRENELLHFVNVKTYLEKMSNRFSKPALFKTSIEDEVVLFELMESKIGVNKRVYEQEIQPKKIIKRVEATEKIVEPLEYKEVKDTTINKDQKIKIKKVINNDKSNIKKDELELNTEIKLEVNDNKSTNINKDKKIRTKKISSNVDELNVKIDQLNVKDNKLELNTKPKDDINIKEVRKVKAEKTNKKTNIQDSIIIGIQKSKIDKLNVIGNNEEEKKDDKEKEVKINNAIKILNEVKELQLESRASLINYEILEEAIIKANGICKYCNNQGFELANVKKSAPDYEKFYLEIHFIKPLSENGEIEKSNIIALCSNCRKMAKLGKGKAAIERDLKRIAKLN